MVWPDVSPVWHNVDRHPNSEARERAYAALQRLVLIPPGSVAVEHDAHEEIPFLRFDDGGQAIFDSWRSDLEQRLRSGHEHPAIEAHLAKYRSLMPSIALILHLLDAGTGPVDEVSAAKAVRWCGYLESHARRLYASVTEAPAVAAKLLANRIHGGDVPNPFAARDVYRNGWAGLDRERTELAIDVLLALHWLDEHIENSTGKPRTRYAINPKIEICPGKALTKLTEAP